MEKNTFTKRFVKQFIKDFYDEAAGDLENCIETATMIAEAEYLVEYGYEEGSNGLH